MKVQIYSKKEDKTFLKNVGYGLLGGGALAITGGALTIKFWTEPSVNDDGTPDLDSRGKQETDTTAAGNGLGSALIITGALSVFASASLIGIGFLSKELK